MTTSRSTVIAIPVRNEVDEIGGCLTALADQRDVVPGSVVLCLNNCTDDTAARVAAIAPSLPFPVDVIDVCLPPAHACAGVSRRIAMDRAAATAGADGIVLTTDADGRVAPDWLARNLAALNGPVDAVAGRAVIDPEGAKSIPPHLHAIDMRECGYAALLDEIAALLDPDPYDPWPRHDEHSGASIAVTVEAYRRAGGMPPIRLGEDRAFFDALRRVDARIRHEPGVLVTVSARIVGRAAGGMADTIRRRIGEVDALLDERLEPAADAVRRIWLRRGLRAAWRARETLLPWFAARTGLTEVKIAELLAAPTFGDAWQTAEVESPVLQRRRVALADLQVEIDRARRFRDMMRASEVVNHPVHRGGTVLDAAAD